MDANRAAISSAISASSVVGPPGPKPRSASSLIALHDAGVAVADDHCGVVVAEVDVPAAVQVPDVATLGFGDVVRVRVGRVGALDDAAGHRFLRTFPLRPRLGRQARVLFRQRLHRSDHGCSPLVGPGATAREHPVQWAPSLAAPYLTVNEPPRPRPPSRRSPTQGGAVSSAGSPRGPSGRAAGGSSGPRRRRQRRPRRPCSQCSLRLTPAPAAWVSTRRRAR